jgi:NADPH2:quinone reductase
VAWEGRILVIGFAGGRMTDAPANQVLFRNYSVVGVYLGEYSHRDRPYLDWAHAEVLRLHAEGKISPLIHAALPMEAAPQAIVDLSRRRTAGKTVIRVTA